MTQQVLLEDLVTNGRLNVRKFFEMQFTEGIQMSRFVDDINVNWAEVSQNMGRSPEECRVQYEYLLDELYERVEFGKEDREKLYLLITMKQIQFKKNGLEIQDEDIQAIQEKYFPDYSSEVIRMEIQAALGNFKQFLEEEKQ